MHVSYTSKKLLMKQKTSSTWGVLLWKDYRWFMTDLSIFDFFVKFHMYGPAIILSFRTTTEHVSYASKKLLIKQRTSSTWWVLLWKYYGWFLIDRFSIFCHVSQVSDFQFLNCSMLVSQEKSGPGKIFSFSTIREHDSYASKKLLIKQKTSSTRCVLLWNDYGWFLIEI